MNGQRPNIAAGKLERLNGEAVSRDHHLAIAEVDLYSICLDVNFTRRQRLGKHFLDEFAHEASAVTMRQ